MVRGWTPSGVLGFDRVWFSSSEKKSFETISGSGDIPLSPHDLEGIKRLPFDAKQTIFCDKVRPGCTPVTARKCSNPRFRQSCYKMPIWEDEVSIQVLDSKMVNLIIDKMMMICIMKMNMRMFFSGKMFRHVENRRFFSTNSSKSWRNTSKERIPKSERTGKCSNGK